MTRVIKQASVEYSSEEMLLLVNDINAYPEFLPWCKATNVMEDNGDSLTASISIAVGKIKQTFTTENTTQAGNSIIMRLVQGPFKELNGHWKFQDDTDNGCLVSLDMQFEFKNKLVKLTFGTVFQKIVDSLIDAFVKRARVVYGAK